MRQRRLRIGVIGTGIGAQIHLPSLAALADAEIVALCGRNAAKVETVADAYDIRHTFADYRDLVRCDDVDAVTIATPSALHHPIALTAIASRKHVLCEKPLARTANEAREMARMAELHGVTAMVCHEFRFLPARARMKELIDEGFIGDLSLVQLSFLRGLRDTPRAVSQGWLTDEASGVLGAIGSHAVDALRWWFGEILEVAGAATATALRGRNSLLDSPATSAEDTAALVLRFASGAIGSVTVSGVAAHGPGEEIRAFGSVGTLTIAPDGTLWGARTEQPTPVQLGIPGRLLGSGVPEVDATPDVHPLIPPFIRLARHWLDGIAADASPSPSFADGLRVQEVLDAVHRSQLQHKWVDVSGARWPAAPPR